MSPAEDIQGRAEHDPYECWVEGVFGKYDCHLYEDGMPIQAVYGDMGNTQVRFWKHDQTSTKAPKRLYDIEYLHSNLEDWDSDRFSEEDDARIEMQVINLILAKIEDRNLPYSWHSQHQERGSFIIGCVERAGARRIVEIMEEAFREVSEEHDLVIHRLKNPFE